MKKVFIIILANLALTSMLIGQIKVNQQHNNNCLEIYNLNPNGYKWGITTGHPDNWGHYNSLDFINNNSTYTMQLFSNNLIGLHGQVLLNFWGYLNHSIYGSKGDANGFLFGHYDKPGLIIENGYGEGSGFFCNDDYAAIWSPGDMDLLRVYDEDGMQLKWYIDGDGYDYHYSDERAKTNIKSINKPLNKLKNIKSVTFNYLDAIENSEIKLKQENSFYANDSIANIAAKINKQKTKRNNTYYGFLAQEVELVYPELVQTDTITGKKYVNYTGMIPIMLEALKEVDLKAESIDKLQNINDSLLKIVSTQQIVLNKMEKRLYSLEKCVNCKSQKSAETVETPAETTNSLSQNTPNPFTQSTEIAFYLNSEVKKAQINIYNLQGSQIKNYPVADRGNAILTIQGSELKPGMYLYTLIADGQEVDTKRMILTE